MPAVARDLVLHIPTVLLCRGSVKPTTNFRSLLFQILHNQASFKMCVHTHTHTVSYRCPGSRRQAQVGWLSKNTVVSGKARL